MGKVKLIRASRLPVLKADFDAFQTEFRLLYDKILARFGASTIAPKVMSEEESRRMQWLIERCQVRLFKKYKLEQDVEAPKSALAWRRLVAAYEAPITVAQAQDTKDLILIIQDM